MQLLTQAPIQLLTHGHTHPLRQVAPGMVVAQVTLMSHSHHVQKMHRCPWAPLWPAAHSPACLLAPSSLAWEGLWDGQKSLRGADAGKGSWWCYMPQSSSGPAGSNRQGHLRIQGEYSLFWGSRKPQTARSRPPALPGEGASRPWVDSHPSLIFWQEVAIPGLYLWECWPAPCLLWYPSTQRVPSRDSEGPFGARLGSVQV